LNKSWNKILCPVLFLLVSIQNICLGEEYWQQFVHYQIDARLNSNKHIIEGFETLRYQNNSPDTLSTLYFHLYPNAFQKNSVMAKEARNASVEIVNSPQEEGWLKIESVTISKFCSINQAMKIDTLVDDTILEIRLSTPLLPTEQLQISLKFTTKIRQFNFYGGKGGYGKNLYEVSQWYPKMCVYDEKGWHPTKYHWLGEFYGEFGTFDVTLDVPDSFIVAGTGVVVLGDPGWKSVEIDSNGNRLQQFQNNFQASPFINNPSARRIVKFHAENVHDFVWCASPDYLYQTKMWKYVPIHVLFRKSSQDRWSNHALVAADSALTWLNDFIGEYPYPQLTLCEGLLSGGMEYPMVSILGNVDLTLVVHEICHNYIQGAVANNELDEGWLDEGIVTYLSELLVEENVPANNTKTPPAFPFKWNFIMRQFDLCEFKDIKLNSLYYYFYSGFETPLSTPYNTFKNRYLYSYNVYLKPSKILSMLDYLVGRDTFTKILRTYYQRYKFKHVDSHKFQTTCEEVAGFELGWFFDQWIKTTARVDYACAGIKTEKQKKETWKTDINIKRMGDAIMPVEVEIVTKSGDSLRQRWDGNTEKGTLSFSTSSPVKDVRLDPDDIILDQNRFNNGTQRIKSYLYPEFPSMYYLPRDAYTLFYWPKMWYNDLDGFKIGVKLLGGYLNRYYITRTHLWYGFKSNQIDFKFGYSMPWESINRNLWRHFYVLKMEGRTEVNANLYYNRSKKFAGSKSNSFRLGFSYQNAYDEQYTFRRIRVGDQTIKIQEWDKGKINKMYFSFQSNCLKSLPRSKINFDAQVSNKIWWSDYNFIRLSADHQATFGGDRQHLRLKVRNFIGYSNQTDSKMPQQDLFWVAEGNPNQKLNYYYLRSIGSMPACINYHLPGDGNLRGYLNKLSQGQFPLAGPKLISTSFDLTYRTRQFFRHKKIRKFLQGIDFCIFFDAGRVWVEDLNQDYLFDAGCGFRFYKIILGKQRMLRIDFPIWVSQPELDHSSPAESQWKFRWIVSFQ